MNTVIKGWMGENPKCVVMCGGKSTRFGSVNHKSGTKVQEQPLIYHVIEYWKKFTNDFVFVVKHGKDELIAYIETLPIKSQFVEPERLGGIAHGLSYAESLIDGPFILVLGDCFCNGDFDFSTPFQYGIGVVSSNPEQIKQNYSVIINDRNLVTEVKEKPDIVESNLCGTGFYFLQNEIFEFIKITAPSTRTGELEITDVLETLLKSNVDLYSIELNGTYINVTVPADLLDVRNALEKT